MSSRDLSVLKMGIIFEGKSTAIQYQGELPLDRFYMLKDRPNIRQGDVVIVPLAQANTILHSKIGFVKLTVHEAALAIAKSVEEQAEQT